jgi:ABC-type transport system involved in multi-copper enzyme maturation permease subunit
MIASWRAELFVLRKSRAVWVLVLVAPLMVLVQTYLFGFALYLGLTPATEQVFGSAGENLPALLPSQFVIEAIGDLIQTAPFIVLGAYVAGADWSRGTLRTSLLQGQSRARCFGGQVLAVMTACAISVLLSFVLAGLASLAIRGYVGGPAAAAAGPFPPVGVDGEAIGAGLLIGFAYGALGIALGTLCRSAAGGIAAALAWAVLVDGFLYDLSTDTGPLFTHLYDALPGASLITLISMFGSSGGGASSATYQPVPPWAAAAVLAAYTVAFLGLALVLLLRRDITAAARPRRWFGWFRRFRRRARRPARPRPVFTGSGLLASMRSELGVMSRWPAMWALVLILPVFTLLGNYVEPFVLYLNAGSGAITLASPAQVLPGILPGQFVPAVLSSIGTGLYLPLPGTALFFLIGALAAGRDWAGGTLRTSLLQGPARARTSAGQALAVLIAAAVSVLLTFAAAGLFSMLTAAGVDGSVSPAASPLPTAARLAAGIGLGLLVAATWSAVGWTAGTLLRSATAAFAVIVLWATIVQLQLDQDAIEFVRPLRAVYDLLPDAATNTLTGLFGFPGIYGAPSFCKVAPLLAFLTLTAYTLACLTLPVAVTLRRDVT